MSSVRVVVRGHVQGVGYRWFTRDAAVDAGVSGWVRNRRDGSVEAELHGPDAEIEAVLAMMAHGPAGARVEDVSAIPIDEAPSAGFKIRSTA